MTFDMKSTRPLPSTMGMTKALIAKVSETSVLEIRAGKLRGSVIDRWAFHPGAPSDWAASSRRGSIDCIAPISVSVATGMIE